MYVDQTLDLNSDRQLGLSFTHPVSYSGSMPNKSSNMEQARAHRGLERPIRRAAAACYRCHWRKVRCDAAINGHPCTNCALDGRNDCALRPNSTSRFKSLQQSEQNASLMNTTMASNASAAAVNVSPMRLDTSNYNSQMNNNNNSNLSTDFTFPIDMDFPNLSMPAFDINPTEFIAESESNTNNTYTHAMDNSMYPGQHFVNLDRLCSLPMDEVHVLAVNGCLEIPPKAALDIFVKKYFLLLHPSQPILDERHFWTIYNQSPNESGSGTPSMSLFVFQAMLLASCPFVPIETIQKCGFRDIHDARRILYNRAKVLYDTNFESHPLARAQGALLLTYYTTAEEPQASMTWNLCAIQNAMAKELHPSNNSTHDPQRSLKRRVWWSIFVRDRTLWLGRHRTPQFISTNFNMSLECPDESDYENEIMFSQVFSPDAKKLLVKLFQAQCQLATILTDVISIAFSASDGYVPYYPSLEEFRGVMTRIQLLKRALTRWKDDCYGPLELIDLPEQEPINVHMKVTDIHYQTARMALAHHEALLVENHLDFIREESKILRMMVANDLKDAIKNMTQDMGYFCSKNLVEKIPLSVLAHCGTPMILAAIDAKFSESNSDTLEPKGSLDFFSEIIRQSRQIYDVAGFFSDGTNNILQLAYAIARDVFLQEESPASSQATHRNQDTSTSLRLFNQPDLNGSNTGDSADTSCRKVFKGFKVKNWIDVFLRHPRAYLRISTCIDYSLATGRLPRDECLPPLVRDTASFLLRIPDLPWTVNLHVTVDNRGNIIPYGGKDRRGRFRIQQDSAQKDAAWQVQDQNQEGNTTKDIGLPSMNDTWYLGLLQNEGETFSTLESAEAIGNTVNVRNEDPTTMMIEGGAGDGNLIYE